MRHSRSTARRSSPRSPRRQFLQSAVEARVPGAQAGGWVRPIKGSMTAVPAPAPGTLGMQRFARAWRAAAVVGLAIFVAHTLLGRRLGLDDFFNRWLYNALILLGLAACVIRT